MSDAKGPVERWTTATGLEGDEARAAKLFAQVAQDARVAEPSPQTVARHLAALDEAGARGGFRLRLSGPVAAAALLGTSLAFAAATPELRTWVRERLESVGVLAPEPRPEPRAQPKPAAVEKPGAAVAPAAEVARPSRPDVVAAVPAPAPEAAPSAPAGVTGRVEDRVLPPPPAKPASSRAEAPRAPVAVRLPTPPTPPAPPAAAPRATAAVPKPATASSSTSSTPAAAPPPAEPVPDTPDIPEFSALDTRGKVEALLKRGDAKAAWTHVEAEPGDHSEWMTLLRGEVLQARRRCAEAIPYFTRVIDTWGVEELVLERALYGRAICHATLGDRVSSHADIDAHVSRFPKGRLKMADERLHKR